MLNIFTCACWSSAFPLWKHVYSVLLPILKSEHFCLFVLMLSHLSCLYMLGINLLLAVSIANIFFHLVGFVVYGSFVVQKLLNFIRPHWFIFALVSFALGEGSKTLL